MSEVRKKFRPVTFCKPDSPFDGMEIYILNFLTDIGGVLIEPRHVVDDNLTVKPADVETWAHITVRGEIWKEYKIIGSLADLSEGWAA